jgi:hypothetical protein
MPGSRNQWSPRFCTCGPAPQKCVRNDEYLTQTNDPGEGFRSQPRLNLREVDLSCFRGRLPLEEAVSLRLRSSSRHKLARPERALSLDGWAVRYTKAGCLRDAGFVIVHTPGAVINGPHCSVVLDYETGGVPKVPWPPHMVNRAGPLLQ